MLSLLDLVNRTSPPAPWNEGDNIPWNDPEFSERMLAEHLSQDHDLASRRAEKIEAQVARMLRDLPPPPSPLLDIACGPGLYLNRLAAAGHPGVGIDFSPASIEHAVDTAAELDVQYRHADIRTAEFGTGFGGVLLLYGQINVFQREIALSILAKTCEALLPGGVLVLEPQTYQQIRETGMTAPSWSTQPSGLFSTQPHLVLTENSWEESTSTGTTRIYVVDANTGSVTRHALSNEAYTEDQLTKLLITAGFGTVTHRRSLTGDPTDDGLSAVIATK
jgi:SAM-dependent methyltransferase